MKKKKKEINVAESRFCKSNETKVNICICFVQLIHLPKMLSNFFTD